MSDNPDQLTHVVHTRLNDRQWTWVDGRCRPVAEVLRDLVDAAAYVDTDREAPESEERDEQEADDEEVV